MGSKPMLPPSHTSFNSFNLQVLFIKTFSENLRWSLIQANQQFMKDHSILMIFMVTVFVIYIIWKAGLCVSLISVYIYFFLLINYLSYLICDKVRYIMNKIYFCKNWPDSSRRGQAQEFVIVKVRVLSHVLVNSWTSLQKVKRGPWDRVCNGLIHPPPPPDHFFEPKTAN